MSSNRTLQPIPMPSSARHANSDHGLPLMNAAPMDDAKMNTADTAIAPRRPNLVSFRGSEPHHAL